jgi:peptidoglycan/LPS O-acetylase OafA/YrhL
MTTDRPPKKARLDALSGVRFLGALHVLLFHLTRGRAAQAGLADVPFWINGILDSGYVAVSLFFILSGFILVYVYLDAEGTRCVPARTFWWARFARLYPLYVVSLVVAAPLFFYDLFANLPASQAATEAVVDGAATVTLTQAWAPTTLEPGWNCPAWALSAEVFYYLLFPWIAVWCQRLSQRRLLPLVGIFWILAMAAPAAYLLFGAGEPARATAESTDFWLAVVKFNPLLRLPEFLAGVVLGRLYLLRAATARDMRASRVSDGAVLSSVAAVAILAALAFSGEMPYPLLHNGLLLPLFAMLIFGLAQGGGPLVWLLARPSLVLLGEASYALYILHVPLLGLAIRLSKAMDIGGRSASALFALVSATVTIGLAVLAYRWIENPARRFLVNAVNARSAIRRAVP